MASYKVTFTGPNRNRDTGLQKVPDFRHATCRV